MSMYPVFLKLQNKNCVVIGGGKIALRKVKSLLECGATVTLIAPEIKEELKDLEEFGSIIFIKKEYTPGDLKNCFLVIAATNSAQTNNDIFREAEKAGILVNVVDDPVNCNFYVPATIRRNYLNIAISTSGNAPYFAKKMREYLENIFHEDIIDDLESVKKIRAQIIKESAGDENYKKQKFEELLKPEVEKLLKQFK